MKSTNVVDIYALSPIQQGMLFHGLYEPESQVYVDQTSVRLKGPLDCHAFQKAWEYIVDRHAVLRTSFHWEVKKPVQVVHQHVVLPWQMHDWRDRPPAEQSTQLAQFLSRDRQQGFEFTQVPLLRVAVIRLADETHQIIISKHHILLDGWSRMLVFKEIFEAYNALRQGHEPYLPSPTPYRNYITWLGQQDMDQAEEFWRGKLQGFNTLTRLAIETPNDSSTTQSEASSSSHQTCSLCLDEVTTTALQSLARQHQLTLSTLVFGAWGALLSRYSGESDVVFGVTSSGRPAELPQVESIVGPFLNTLPLRMRLQPDDSPLSWLRQLQTQQIAMRQYEYAPLVKIQGWSEIPQSTPLFETIVVFENYPVDRSLSAGEALSVVDSQTVNQTHYPLTLIATAGAQLNLEVGYDSGRFNSSAIDRLLQQMQTWLSALCIDPHQPLHALSALPQAEQQLLLTKWNGPPAEYPLDLYIPQLFEQQVTQTPEAIALIWGDSHLTYRQLDNQANQLAHHLQRLGIGPESRVGLCLDRSSKLLVALLAVLKAGGAYVPFDATYPAQRLAFVLADAQCTLLITQTSLLSTLSRLDVPTVCLDGVDNSTIQTQPTTPPPPDFHPEQLAYLIYTSGSTGQPKGVQIPHRAMVNFLGAMQQHLQMTPQDRLLAVTSLSFDISVLELLLPLIIGGQVELLSREHSTDGDALMQRLDQGKATVMMGTPAAWQLLLAAGWQGSPNLTMLCGGEALSPTLAAALQSRGRVLWNLYGPTEATICSTAQAITNPQTVTIGRAIANTQVYVLDAQQTLTPIGVPGELYIGGVGVARGYLHRPGLTAEKFVPDPFSSQPGARLYRTGDLVRYTPSGQIDWLARLDHQVKIRGFRIEIGEIEATLQQHPHVRQTVVIAREALTGGQRLIAYVVPTEENSVSTQEIHQFLKTQLPAFMLPSAIVILDALPLTPNLKVDRRALPHPGDGRHVDTPYAAPNTFTERQLAELWAALLDVQQIGLNDNFFELGGHSILSIQLLSQIKSNFEVDLSVRHVFETGTLRDQAQLIDRVKTQGAAALATLTQAVDLRAEAVLDETIRATTPWMDTAIAAPSCLLLTGATGFLGAFLLNELLQQTQATIFCLVRAANLTQARNKLQQNLASYNLWQDRFDQRIFPILGDLGKPNLGLSPSQFETLAGQLDGIYHNGALVNFVYSYAALKAVNVLGTQAILRLASEGKVKPVHFISTLSVFSSGDRATKTVIREQDVPECCDKLQSGYSQSKWVAERLMAIASERGIPICIYRPGRVTGTGDAGICNTDDFMARMIKGCIQLGCAPEPEDNAFVDMTPVDYVSRSIVYLSQQRDSIGKAFHLVNPNPMRSQQLLSWMVNESGYPLVALPYEQWHTQLTQTVRSSEHVLFPLLPYFMPAQSTTALATLTDEESGIRASPAVADASISCQSTLEALQTTSISCPALNSSLLKTYFSYFARSGFLPEPNQVTSSSNLN